MKCGYCEEFQSKRNCFLTREPDAAHRRAVVSMHPGHRRPHGRRHGPVVQQQQPAAVRHVHLAQQVPTEGHVTSETTHGEEGMVAEGDGRASHLDLTRTIAASGVSRSSSPETSVNKRHFRPLSCDRRCHLLEACGTDRSDWRDTRGSTNLPRTSLFRITKEPDGFHF